MQKIQGYCDGACKDNPGIGGWGCFHTEVSGEKDGLSLELCFENFGGEKQTTNNRMELTAIIMLLKQIPKKSIIEIFTDSGYVVDGLLKKSDCLKKKSDGDICLDDYGNILWTGYISSWVKNGWVGSKKAPVKNKDLWKKLMSEISQHLKSGSKINISWVKAHAKNDGNNRADELANKGCREN